MGLLWVQSSDHPPPPIPPFPLPPLQGGYQLRYLRPWFWFSLGSSLASISGLVLASLLLTYLTPVPPAGIEAYLERWQGLYVGAIAGFILSVLLQVLGGR